MSRDTSIAREFTVSGFFLPIVVSYNMADDPDRHRDRGRFIGANTLRKSRFMKIYNRGQRKNEDHNYFKCQEDHESISTCTNDFNVGTNVTVTTETGGRVDS